MAVADFEGHAHLFIFLCLSAKSVRFYTRTTSYSQTYRCLMRYLPFVVLKHCNIPVFDEVSSIFCAFSVILIRFTSMPDEDIALLRINDDK